MAMPNFLIIGAAKAGTTALYAALAQHPQIYMSPSKEPRFFALEGETPDFGGVTHQINTVSVTDLKAYHRLFEPVADEVAVGEASTIYLYNAKAPARIKHHIPDVKLIAILRDPAERAFSSYVHLVRDGYETLSFTEGLKAEKRRMQENYMPLWFYRDRGFYYEQLMRYYKLFDPAQIKIYLYEDLLAGSTHLIQDICRFLSVDDGFTPSVRRANVSGLPKRRWLQQLFMQDNVVKSAFKPLVPNRWRQLIARNVQKKNLGAKPVLSPENRQQLTTTYKDDILRLQDLIKRDLSGWLQS